ncbi:MAG: hypothetical protein WCH98_19020, partial [Verrucomicrobiota bacterium]
MSTAIGGGLQYVKVSKALPNLRGLSHDILRKLKTIVQGIQSKLKAAQGKLSAAELAPDIAAFDALLAKHSGEKTDEMAQVAYKKAG